MTKKLRKMGDIMFDVEDIIQEMVYEHGMQAYEIMGLIYSYIQSHAPEAIEEYEDGTNPVYFYGPKEIK